MKGRVALSCACCQLKGRRILGGFMKNLNDVLALLFSDTAQQKHKLAADFLAGQSELLRKTLKRLVDDSSAKDSLIKTLRAAPSPRYALSDLIEKRCPSCGNARLHVCRYPLFVSAFFSGRLLLRCGACGLGWEPDDQLDLEDYYVNHYAREFRQDR